MTIEAKIIADSISQEGIRLTTMQLRYPRFIHAEAKTHRVITIDGVQYEEMIDMGFMDDPNLSRNASSSRAIPVERMISDLRRDPAMPVYWGANQKGMQAAVELTEVEIVSARQIWLNSMENAIHSAELLMNIGLHKQIANRMLEPWAHINVVVTATDWDNFYHLRRHKDAQPEMRVLAEVMRDAQMASEPIVLLPGEWHLPYIKNSDRIAAREIDGGVNLEDPEYYNSLIAISVARCARVSFLTHDGRETTIEEDIKLYERLVGSEPLHASPCEHQATPDYQHEHENGGSNGWNKPEHHGNFTGWVQFRKTLPGEHR